MDATLTPSQTLLLTISNNIIIGLSLIALSAFFIGTWLKSARAFTLWLKIIFNLFFTDFLLSLSNLLTNFSKEDPAACQAEGFLRTFSLWSSTLWANIIALVAFYKTVKSSLTIDRKYKTFLIVAYGWPFILAILPTIPGLPFKYESNGIVCWVMVSDSYSDYYILLKWAYLFFWVWVAIIFTTVLYILLYRFLKKYSIEAVFTQYRGILIFPVILYITLIPVTIGNTGINHRYPFAMAVTQVFTLNTLGLFHIAAYGYQRLRAMASMKKSLSQKIRIHEESSVSSSLETIFDEYPVIQK